MPSLNSISGPGHALNKVPCLVQRHSDDRASRNAEKIRKNRVLGPNDDSATDRAPLSHLLSAISPDYSSAFFFDRDTPLSPYRRLLFDLYKKFFLSPQTTHHPSCREFAPLPATRGPLN
jgi:hypothetical protein